jgi:hypothetical protein
MATRNAQTQAKRARELALREKRERKREKKEARRAGIDDVDGLVEAPNDPDALAVDEEPADPAG